jgi:hypothetical protein
MFTSIYMRHLPEQESEKKGIKFKLFFISEVPFEKSSRRINYRIITIVFSDE